MVTPILPGQGHTRTECACCHHDDAHTAFPSGTGVGEFVLCQECLNENWEPLRAGAEKAVKDARDAIAAHPGEDGYLLVLELMEAGLEMFNARHDDEWDMPRLNGAVERIDTAQKAIATYAELHSGPTKGTA